MLQKTPHISYPGELPDIDHQTISLRMQLRLSYETYGWVRYLTWSGLLLLVALLVFLPGGFPPPSAVQFWQTLPLLAHLISMHGFAALFSWLALGAQALTWLIFWIILVVLCNSLARYTWRMHRARPFLTNAASAWQSSAALSNGKQGELALVSLARTAPLSSTFAPEPAELDLVKSQKPTLTRDDQPFMQLVRPLTAPDTQVLPRQFAQPTALPTRPRPSPQSVDLSGSGWPLGLTNNGPGIVWDRGLKRKERPNEDSVLTLRGTCNFYDCLLPFELHIVADGMGGHAQGSLASHLAIRSMLETVVPGLVACETVESEQIVDILIDGVHWANQVIYQYGQEHNADMGTTVTAVLLINESAYIINVGDSRTYVYRPNAGLTQITRDHSLVARLVETGAITPEEIYTHPDRNKVYRGLGDKTDVTVDWFVLPVQSGDLLLLCSDGLWEMVRDPGISEILQTYSSSLNLASNALLRAALQAGGSDNVSLLLARVV